jgi:hypothetical protein
VINGLIGVKSFLQGQRDCFKDLLLGKLSIPKEDDKFDEILDIGKKMARTIELNEVAYTELILTIDVKGSHGKIAFNIVKECKSTSMVKLDKQFRDSTLKKVQDPEVWMAELEDFRMILDYMGSRVSENEFMIHVLNNLPTEYDLQLALWEKRIED